MGVHANIGHDDFPAQGSLLNQRVRVCFRRDTGHTIGGLVVRDDMEEPFRTIIRLDDGRHVLADECQYTVEPPTPEARR